jgi:hypothetical protein
MAGSGRRAEFLLTGRLIAMAAGAGTRLTAGPGFHTSLGAGCRITMDAGYTGAAAGVGFQGHFPGLDGAGLHI